MYFFYLDIVAIDGDVSCLVEIVRNDVFIAVSDVGRDDFKRHFGEHLVSERWWTMGLSR